VFFSTGPRDDSDTFFQEYVVPNVTASLAVRGSGTVSVNPTGTACATASCAATVLAGTSLTLTARPANGYRFAGWSGGCTGTNPTCTIDVEDNVSVTAVFTVLTLPLTVKVIGKGTVSGPGVSCGGTGRRCKAVLRWGQIARLTARGVGGGRFDRWAGACHGRSAVCSVKISRATSVVAVFK
jgi:uncharacterized repeat protein (TIGR02543 family)